MTRKERTGRAAGIGAVAVLAAGLAAQETTDVAKADSEQLLYARIVVKEQRVQCFPTTKSPLFDDRLTEGDVVKVGPMVGAFRQVHLPMGATGYVHRAFCALGGDQPLSRGLIKTTRAKVSFRYRAKSGEAPHSLLPKDTELFYLGAEGDWYRVRLATARAFVPVNSVQVFQSENATLTKAWTDLEQRRRQEWDEVVRELDKLQTIKKERDLQAHKLAELRKRFAAVTSTTQKNPEVQRDQLRKLHTEVLALDKELMPPAKKIKGEKGKTDVAKQEAPKKALSPQEAAMSQRASVLRQQARFLAVEVQGQIRLAEAVAAIQRKPKPAKDVKISKPEPGPSRSERADAVGWLRYDRSATGTGRFRLEKGRKLIAYVRSTSERYDLSKFVGVEIAVRGNRGTGGLPAAPVIDVTRLEVLAVGDR